MTPEAAFSRGAELASAGEHEAAIPFFERAATAYPHDQAVLWNLGIANAAIGAHEQALGYWSLYRQLYHADWRGRAKVIQAHQALGDLAARDREREALFSARAEVPADHDLRMADRYCREQAKVAGKTVFAFEYFEPKGSHPVFYSFSVVDDAGYEVFAISLGSYQATNEIQWEMGTLPRSKRIYHLDRYDRNMHSTYAFFEEKPGYDELRRIVARILADED